MPFAVLHVTPRGKVAGQSSVSVSLKFDLTCFWLGLVQGRCLVIQFCICILKKLLNFKSLALQGSDLAEKLRVRHQRKLVNSATELQILEVVLVILIDELEVELAEEGFLWQPNFLLKYTVLVGRLNNFPPVHKWYFDECQLAQR